MLRNYAFTASATVQGVTLLDSTTYFLRESYIHGLMTLLVVMRGFHEPEAERGCTLGVADKLRPLGLSAWCSICVGCFVLLTPSTIGVTSAHLFPPPTRLDGLPPDLDDRYQGALGPALLS